jgi:hypothetical protein
MTALQHGCTLSMAAQLRNNIENDGLDVYLTREARDTLATLDPSRRAALSDGFGRVGGQLLSAAEQVTVEPGWARRSWPGRRYPQQRYWKTAKYVLDHPQIKGMRLIHGVVSRAPVRPQRCGGKSTGMDPPALERQVGGNYRPT